jgi:DNA-binding CsgD family transcriptional regulator/tetratricopeptide (TPR) repeat protein
VAGCRLFTWQFLSGVSDFILVGMAVTGSSALVGRAEELARLLAALDQAEQGRPAMVLIAGDAGVGKTRLVAELAHQARQRGVRVLVGGCLEVGDVGLPYVPVVAALRGFAAEADGRALLATAAKGLPRLARLLPELADEPNAPASLGEGLEQLQLFDGVGSLLVRLSQHAPLLLVLEDLQWADASTRELVAFLHQTLRTGRLLLVATYRSDELQRRHPLWPWLAEFGRRPGVARLELGPLSRTELAEQLAAVRGQHLSASAVERIFARSEGNPFYAEELLAVGADHAQVALPRALGEVLLARVQVLSDGAQQVLRVAAVAGRRVSHQLLVAAARRPELEVETGLREAVAAGVLVAESASESYGFRHALLQEAVYGDLLPGERVRLHATYARLLAEVAEGRCHNSRHGSMGVQAAELAYHCLASHDLTGALAASVQAAAQAEAVLAPAEALRHLEQALALWDQVPQAAAVAGAYRVDLLLQAGEAANAAGAADRALSLTRQAICEIDPSVAPLRAAQAHERLASYLVVGRDEEGLQLCLRAAELVPEDPPTPLRARVTAALARALINAGQRDAARRSCTTALAVAQAVGSKGDEADALITLGFVEVQDSHSKARSLFEQARRLAADAGRIDIELRALHNLGYLEYDLGHLAAACAAWDEGARRAWRGGLAWSPTALEMRGLRCYGRYVAGDWDASEQLAAAVDEQVAEVAPALAADALAVQVSRGRDIVERRLAQLTSLNTPNEALEIWVVIWVAIHEAEQASWHDDVSRASSAIERGLEATVGAVRWAQEELMLCAAGLAVQAAQAEQARASGDPVLLTDAVSVGRAFVDRARLMGQRADRSVHGRSVHVPAWLARAEAEWSRVEGQADPARWQIAVEAFSFGCVYEVARCRWRLAEALLATGERTQAATAARAAYQTAARLEAAPLRGALEALARRAHLDLGAGQPQQPERAGLTPREQEVLRLLAEGRSNRQIAAALFISGKTASVHVTHILTKLGVHSRLEAAARARELGLDRIADPSRP